MESLQELAKSGLQSISAAGLCARLFGFGRYVVAFHFSRGRDCSIFVDTCRARKAAGWFIPHFAQFVPETIWMTVAGVAKARSRASSTRYGGTRDPE
jgi:hypothetical protein